MDEKLKKSLHAKIQAGKFAQSDIPAYFDLFCQLGNVNAELQAEVESWNRRLMFVIDGLGTYVITVDGGQLGLSVGASTDVELVLKMSAAEAVLIFSGDKDATAAYLAGDLVVEGELPDAIKMQALLEIVAEEIEY